MTSLDSFLDYLLPMAPECATPQAIQALRSSCIEFCRNSQIVQDINTYNVVADQSDYDLDVPQQQSVAQLITVMWDTTRLDVTATNDVRNALALRGAVDTYEPETGSPKVAFFKTPTEGVTLSLYPVPDASLTQGLTVRCAYMPTRTATQVEDVLFVDHVETIALGALYRLQRLPGQPFSNPAASASNKMMFDRGVSSARNDFYQGRTAANMRVRPVSFV